MRSIIDQIYTNVLLMYNNACMARAGMRNDVGYDNIIAPRIIIYAARVKCLNKDTSSGNGHELYS